MPFVLESGKLQLSREEAADYRSAADRLHESCRMPLDLSIPMTIEEWMFLRLADDALSGDFNNLDRVIAHFQNEVQRRRDRQ